MSNQSPKDTDVTDIFDLVDFPIIRVGVDCALVRFNGAAAGVFHLTTAEIGRPLRQIRTLSDHIRIHECCSTVIAGGSAYRGEVRDNETRFLLRIAAYPGGERPVIGAVLTFTNITAFHASIQQAIHERQFTKSILNTVTEPLVVLNAELRVQTANRAFFTMFHLSREEVHGSLFTELKHHRWDVPQLWKQMKDPLDGENFPPLELEHDFPTLGRRTILLTVHRLDESRSDMFLLMFRDMTERKQEEQALRASEERLRQFAGTLEERVRERTQELATSYTRLRALATELTVAEQTERRRVATELHDYLAQLLVVIRMKTSQLLKQDHEPDVRKVLEEADQLVLQSLDYTRSLVSELIPQALYESGLGAALLWLGDQMRRQQLLNVEISLDAPDLCLPEEDAVLLFHSIRELLFNVLKHGKTDRAAVAMRYAQNELSISVSDQGCGFDVAGLSDEAVNRFGLLSIRERMMALGGRFDLHSEPGKGTVAALILPLMEGYRSSQHAAPELENSEIRSAPPAQKEQTSSQNAIRVLLVDDHAMMREGVRSVLEGYTNVQIVGEARDGEEAIALVESLRPSLVVMDINMSKLNGIDATVHIKSRHPTCRVIGLSVNSEGHDQEAMRQAGADVVLTKHVVADELYQAILMTMAGHVSSEGDVRLKHKAYYSLGEVT